MRLANRLVYNPGKGWFFTFSMLLGLYGPWRRYVCGPYKSAAEAADAWGGGLGGRN